MTGKWWPPSSDSFSGKREGADLQRRRKMKGETEGLEA